MSKKCFYKSICELCNSLFKSFGDVSYTSFKVSGCWKYDGKHKKKPSLDVVARIPHFPFFAEMKRLLILVFPLCINYVSKKEFSIFFIVFSLGIVPTKKCRGGFCSPRRCKSIERNLRLNAPSINSSNWSRIVKICFSFFPRKHNQQQLCLKILKMKRKELFPKWK